MAFLPLRSVAVAEAAAFDEWLGWLRAELERDDCDRNELCG
jgi:hypothetical protein